MDEARMRLALQTVIQQIEITPRKIVGPAIPSIEPYFDSAHQWAYWMVEALISRGISSKWFDAAISNGFTSSRELLLADPAS